MTGRRYQPALGRVVAVLRALVVVVGGYLILLLIAVQVFTPWKKNRLMIDFDATIYEPARAVLEGRTPYPDLAGVQTVAESVYPPLIFVAATPLAALPHDTAAIIWAVILFAAACATLLVLEVRDWRCWALWLASLAVVADVEYGNATLLVILAVAVMWRLRDRHAGGVALAAAVTIKLFAAPLALWLLATRRVRFALAAVAFSGAGIVGGWALIRFDGMLGYPERLSSAADLYGDRGVGVQSLARQLDLGRTAALATGIVVAAGLLVGMWRTRRDDVASLAFAIGAALALTPIAWIYYPALLLIPLAARRPRFSVEWLFLPALWVSYSGSPLEWATWQLSAVVLAICGTLLWRLAVDQPRLVDDRVGELLRDGGEQLSVVPLDEVPVPVRVVP